MPLARTLGLVMVRVRRHPRIHSRGRREHVWHSLRREVPWMVRCRVVEVPAGLGHVRVVRVGGAVPIMHALMEMLLLLLLGVMLLLL